MHLARLFQVLNTPRERRQQNLVEELAELPYVNGDSSPRRSGSPISTATCGIASWPVAASIGSRISPAVFGSLFQSVMEPRERRQIGAHYTSERDILKLVRSLFLDDLRAEFEEGKGQQANS